MMAETALRPETAAIDPAATLMYREAAEAGAAVARFLDANRDAIDRIGARLRAAPPAVVVTCARGSSAHAAAYGKFAIETMTRVVTAPAALSIASIYPARGAPAAARGNRLCIAISQSGRSPDLIAAVEAQRAEGAYVVALVNVADSPLVGIADEVLALNAGPEVSVAATKSYLVSLVGLAAIVAAWTQDAALGEAIDRLPALLPRAFALDWHAALPTLTDATSLFVIGRGYGYGAALEVALKLKETSGLHAECFSAAEVKHGPMALVGRGFPILALAGSDAAGDDVRETAALFEARGARVCLADTCGGAGTLPALADHPMIEPILMVESFYALAARLAVARGHDPDSPPYLNKVTRTV